MNICILIPTTGEARDFIAALKMKRTGVSSFAYGAQGINVALHVCGIGVDNARKRAAALLNQGTACLVLAGYCGGLRENLSIGALVLDTRFPDPDFTAAITRIAESRNIAFHLGSILTSPRLLGLPEEKRAAGSRTAAIAVDMEGDAVLELCRERNIPFRSFRTVSDEVRQRLPGVLAHAPLCEKRPWRFWCALACRVWEWPDVGRMLLSTRLARRNLSTVLVDWVNSLPGGHLNDMERMAAMRNAEREIST